jgi:hypothetical protein
MNPNYKTKGYGNKAVGATAVQLSTSNVPCEHVELINISSGIVYYGFDNSITTANAFGALTAKDAPQIIHVGNLNELFLISDTAAQDVRFIYYSY